MFFLKGHVVVLLWRILSIDGQRWYSATDEGEPSRASMKSNHVEDKLKYIPVITVNSKNQTNKDKFSFLRKYNTTNLSSDAYMKQSKWDLINGQYDKQTWTKNWTPHGNQFVYYEDKTIPIGVANDSRKNRNPVFQINKTITNVNLIKKPKTKGKLVRRCPAIRPRQKKQSNSNQTIQKRFLEVFEVVHFDHVPCVSTNGLEGICLPEFDCQSSQGTSMGSCADGYGTCCVTQFSCDGQSAAPFGWFTNPGFPSPSTERLSCVFTLYKASSDIVQIRLDFSNFELLPPVSGSCEQDQFVVLGQNVNNVIPILCGVNTGQHVYIEVGDVEGPITLSVQTVSSESRLFSIKVTQLRSSDELAASTGCLQYFKGPTGYLESFNFRDKSDIAIARSNSYLNNLNYAMCVERSSATCSVTYTNTGNMQIVNYDSDGLPLIPPGQAGVEIFNCPTDWLLIGAVRLCGERLNDGAILQDFALDAPVTDNGAGPIVIWFRSDGGYVGRGFKLQYQQNEC